MLICTKGHACEGKPLLIGPNPVHVRFRTESQTQNSEVNYCKLGFVHLFTALFLEFSYQL